MRADSAECTTRFTTACRARNVSFAVVARSTRQITEAIFATLVSEECWSPAIYQDGELREGAAVIELTELVELSSFRPGRASSIAWINNRVTEEEAAKKAS